MSSVVHRANYDWKDLGNSLGCLDCNSKFKKTINDGGLGAHKKACIAKIAAKKATNNQSFLYR